MLCIRSILTMYSRPLRQLYRDINFKEAVNIEYFKYTRLLYFANAQANDRALVLPRPRPGPSR